MEGQGKEISLADDYNKHHEDGLFDKDAGKSPMMWTEICVIESYRYVRRRHNVKR